MIAAFLLENSNFSFLVHRLPVGMASVGQANDYFMEIPLYMESCFSLIVLKILFDF
jgi:hypothetical protein